MAAKAAKAEETADAVGTADGSRCRRDNVNRCNRDNICRGDSRGKQRQKRQHMVGQAE